MTIAKYAPARPLPSTLFGAAPSLGTSLTSTGTRDYDARWAYALSVISGWAYAEGQCFADQLPYHGFANSTVYHLRVENPALFIVASAYYVQSQDKRVGVLAFRGTEPTNLVNWLTDANTAKYRFGKGYVHSGFFANVEALWADIVQVVQVAIDEGLEHLYVTGHSLGGAMAVVAAAKMYDPNVAKPIPEWRDKLRGIYTFGQPLVGDNGFKQQFDPALGRCLFRHVYSDDVVPCLPPKEVDGDFVHFGQKRTAGSPDAIWAVSEAVDRRADLLFVLKVLASFVTHRIDVLQTVQGLLSLDDHSPRGYIDVSRNSMPNAGRRAVGFTPPLQGPIARLLPAVVRRAFMS